MKAFLKSHYLEPQHFEKFRELLGKVKANKALAVTTAAVPYGLDPKPEWLEESLRDIGTLTESLDETSLEDGEYIPSDLEQYDFVFISGGNTFYLAYRLAETNLGTKIKQYVENGGLYSGSSAGAIILMDDIEYFAPADDPSKAPQVYPGLGLIDFAIIPHADSEKYAELMKGIATKYKESGKETISVGDHEILVVSGEQKEVI